MERRREQGSESPPSRQPHLAHLLVSPALPGHSSQPLSNRRARERTRGDGRCLEDWNGHGTASRAPPPPTCLTAASGHAAAGVSVRFLFASSACECVRFCAFAHQCRLLSVLCVGGKKESAYCLTVNAAGGTEMRCWGSVREEERERRKRCMWEQGRDNGKGDYLKGPLAPSININQSEMHGCVNDSIEPARVRACTRVCLYETCNKREENKGQIYLHEIRRLPVCVLCSFRVFLVCIKLLPEKFTTRHLHTQRYRVNAHIY